MKVLHAIVTTCILLILSFLSVGCKNRTHNNSSNSSIEHSNIPAEIMNRGKQIYNMKCVTCHMPQGQGVPKAFPPLATSDYLMADRNRAIHQVIYGSSGEMVVNGETYVNIMPPQGLNDEDVAAVLTYVMNSWGNKGRRVTVEEVQKVRTKSR